MMNASYFNQNSLRIGKYSETIFMDLCFYNILIIEKKKKKKKNVLCFPYKNINKWLNNTKTTETQALKLDPKT